ncbi:hypothetical protein ABVK25_004619 [Lepraria finkii]|uniref:Calmodulin n=1 Tax=Lepraria finkii TaxID=1340010 RepID=A0ABR4BE33_9LECA
MAASLTEEQLKDLRATFALFDDDGNGEITATELGNMMRSLGLKPSETELQDIMNEIDSDHSGTISFDAFAPILAHKVANADSDAELRAAFGGFDKDGSGTIDTEALRHLLKSIGEDLTDEQIEEMIREADKDGDGCIDYNEFVQLMR